MKVKELIEHLKKVDQEKLVVMYLGGECDLYSPLVKERIDDDNVSYKDRETGWEHITDEDRKQGFDESTVLEGGEPCVVFYAKNYIGEFIKEPNAKKEHTVRFYTTIGEGDEHYHPMAEIDIESETLEEAIELVKNGVIEVQHECSDCAYCELKDNEFKIIKVEKGHEKI